MKPTVVLREITDRLSKITLDDWYTEPRIATRFFMEITNTVNEREISDCLNEMLNEIYEGNNLSRSKGKKKELTEDSHSEQGNLTENIEKEWGSLKMLILIVLFRSVHLRDEQKLVQTRRIEEVFGGVNFFNLHDAMTLWLKKGTSFPKNWRFLLIEALSQGCNEISGYFKVNHYLITNESIFFQRQIIKNTEVDISFFLAMKCAAKFNESIKIDKNSLALAVSGGLYAKLSFREKGELIASFQQNKFEIFAKRHRCTKDERYLMQTLYFQSGYEDGEVQIKTPDGYYILSENFVIEIEFFAAPVLFNSDFTLRTLRNISSVAAMNDEMEEKQRIEEEEEEDRMNDDDEYWYNN